MEIIGTASEYVKDLYLIKDKIPTYYGYGAVGAPADYKYVGRAYKDNRERYNAPGAPAGSFLFDCAGFAYKAIPWGFTGDPTKCYGGVVWPSKGQPFYELDTNDILSICTVVSDDFAEIKPGEVLYMPGHVGIYVGNGLALECTTGWGVNSVIESQVLNVADHFDNRYKRTWQKHGKLPFLDYEENAPSSDDLKNKLVIATNCLENAIHDLSVVKGSIDAALELIAEVKGGLK